METVKLSGRITPHPPFLVARQFLLARHPFSIYYSKSPIYTKYAWMSLSAQIDEDLKSAMRAKDTLKLGVLRMLKSALKYAAIEKLGAEGILDDSAAAHVIRKQIKQRQDSIQSFEKGGRPELAKKEREEMEVLAAYLPKGFTAEEVTELVREAIAEAGATSKAQMGAVMKIVQTKAAGRADGKTLSAEVQKQLP